MKETKSGHRVLRHLPAVGAAGASFAVWQIHTQRHFRITRHQYLTTKVSSFVRIVSLADLHDHVYGTANNGLIDAVESLRPDLIVVPGDFFTRRKREKKQEIPQVSVRTMLRLQQIAPVYYSFGNHETRILESDQPQRPQLLEALQRFEEAGVEVLRNRRVMAQAGENRIEIIGFEPDRAYYFKGQKISLRKGYLEKETGLPEDLSALQVMLAHAPAFFENYAKTDTDIVFSGHTHGGLVRIPGVGSIVSPELSLFPSYDQPLVEENGTTMYVSKGLGTHTVHLRVFDPAEIVVVDVKPLLP